jgi:hypothetical protein
VRFPIVIHVAAGGIGLVTGFVALYAAKGASVHRRSGMLFIAAMLVMCTFGALVATVWDVAMAINIPAALLTAYLVVTALTTVRPPASGGWWLERAALGVALVVGLASLTFAFQAVANGGMRDGMPAFPFFMFGMIGLLGSVGDFRVLRAGPRRGASRIARHLWRMCTALFIAALSFFIGQADVFPKPMRILPLLALPVVAVLVTMFYWLWRVRIRKSLRGMVGVSVPEAI